MSEQADWIHTRIPPIGRSEVWLESGGVREVNRDPVHGQLLFTDCTHALQNICCDSESVKAWRPIRDNPTIYEHPHCGEYDSLLSGALSFLGIGP